MTSRLGSARLALRRALLLLPFLAGSVSAAPPQRASTLGPEVALAEPKDGFIGTLNVVPENGPAGTPLTVTAEHLPPGQEFQLIWRTVKGSWKVADAEYHGREFTPVAYEITKLRSDR